jgi:hypothetical protein
MSDQTDDDAADDWNKVPYEARPSNRIGQILHRVLMTGAEAQKMTARNLERNARLMLWSVVLAGISTVISAAGFIFVVVYLLHAPH